MTIRSLSDALRIKAAEEINEDPSLIKEHILIMREWLKEQPHLQAVKPTDQWLLSFLRGCKHNMEKAKEKIDKYYTMKATVPEFYGNRDPLDPGIQEILKLGIILPLKKVVSEDSPRIMISRAGLFSQTSRPISDLLKVALMIIEILLIEDDNFCIAGEDLVADCNNLSFGLVWAWTPSIAKKVMTCVQKALSVRVRSMHILNGPFFVGPAVKIFKMFLSTKLKNRIHSHSKDLETLYEHIPKSILPQEYGGTDGTVQELVDYWKAKVESRREWFLEDNECSDESKRNNNKNSGDIISSVVPPLQTLDID